MPVLDDLTPEILRKLYFEDLLTEKDIAKIYETYQVKINRIRHKWGIPTLGKTGRFGLALPPLTPEQDQIIVGSLLGDGWMDATSESSARFCEGHSLKQANYTEWKAQKMSSYTCLIGDGQKIEDGKTFRSRYFYTHSCPQLRPYYDLFYPPPKRVRVFPGDLYSRMTSLVLAVWYMDDGSLEKDLHPRLHFGLDPLSLKRALRGLRILGLRPKTYGEGSNVSIQFPGQFHLFKELVEPYILPSFGYKIPKDTPRQKARRRVQSVASAEVASLYRGGASVKDIAKLYSIGVTTVNRRLTEAGVQKRSSGPRKGLLTVEAATALLDGLECREGDVLELRVDEALRVLKRTPFPYRSRLPKEKIQGVLEKLRSTDMWLDGRRVAPLRTLGVVICDLFFPNRYKARSHSRKVAYESWFLEDELKKAIRFQFKMGDPVTPHRVLRAIVMRCRTPTIFRPAAAKFIYQRYLPAGGITWDPCSGYGGRLLGALAAGVRYVGTDVEMETVEGNRELANCLEGDASIHCCPAELFSPPEVGLVFTSPPYFQRELYAGGDQSWRYHEFESWVENFLKAFVKRGADALVPGGHFVLNVANVRIRGKKIPLVECTRGVLSSFGLREVETLELPLHSLNRKSASEPILVFKKPDPVDLLS